MFLTWFPTSLLPKSCHAGKSQHQLCSATCPVLSSSHVCPSFSAQNASPCPIISWSHPFFKTNLHSPVLQEGFLLFPEWLWCVHFLANPPQHLLWLLYHLVALPHVNTYLYITYQTECFSRADTSYCFPSQLLLSTVPCIK